MAICGIQKNQVRDCSPAIGGAKKRVYFGYVSQLTDRIERDTITAVVDSLPLPTYGSLYYFETTEEGLLPTINSNVSEEGKIVSYTHNFTATVITETAIARRDFEDWLRSEAWFAIMERNTGVFEVWGANTGFVPTEGTKEIGATAQGQNTGFVQPFVARNELFQPFVFDVGGYAATKAYLEALAAE